VTCVPSIEESARAVAAPWKESAYYDDAERWMQVFWRAETIFRRLFDTLDLGTVLELACGHGRHSEYIAARCGSLILMDIHRENIDYCRQRLQSFGNIEYHVNNGYDFHPVASNSLTSIFCYDAMVHFSPDLVQSYLQDTGRVLVSGGHALFHHSNYPAPLERHYGQNPHARNHMTQALFEEYTRAAGLEMVETIIMPWGGTPDLDCLSLVAKALSKPDEA
jgi:ubiquinone/menaquinone biosynthesis C-methylase UbiE